MYSSEALRRGIPGEREAQFSIHCLGSMNVSGIPRCARNDRPVQDAVDQHKIYGVVFCVLESYTYFILLLPRPVRISPQHDQRNIIKLRRVADEGLHSFNNGGLEFMGTTAIGVGTRDFN